MPCDLQSLRQRSSHSSQTTGTGTTIHLEQKSEKPHPAQTSVDIFHHPNDRPNLNPPGGFTKLQFFTPLISHGSSSLAFYLCVFQIAALFCLSLSRTTRPPHDSTGQLFWNRYNCLHFSGCHIKHTPFQNIHIVLLVRLSFHPWWWR